LVELVSWLVGGWLNLVSWVDLNWIWLVELVVEFGIW
jgi:hypothetical protein